jgi:hypothetical protein
MLFAADFSAAHIAVRKLYLEKIVLVPQSRGRQAVYLLLRTQQFICQLF